MARILITEDEKALCSALVTKLQAEGYDVVQATNGAIALELLNKNQYDLALVDLVMPIVDGFKVLEAMQEIPKKTPIVVFTNLAQDADKERVMKLGTVGYYVKSDTPIFDVPRIIKEYIGSDHPQATAKGPAGP